MASGLKPYKEARITPCMVTVGIVLIIVMVIMAFLLMPVVTLA